jgi:hypothetical protein
VIEVRGLPDDPAIAVEAATVLKVEEHRPNRGQAVALAAEQELVQIACLG